MKHISILVPQGDISVANVAGAHQIFSHVNVFLEQSGKSRLFNIQVIGLQKENEGMQGLVAIRPNALINEISQTDLIIIPAIHGDPAKFLELNREFIPWITRMYESGAEVASLCVGSFLLAQTGLLNGKKCATHWLAVNDFRKMFPDVELVPDKIITDEQGLYSSGGAYSGLNLILYLVEKYAGRDMAILCSKVFQIEIERSSQSAFMIFNSQKEHEDEEIKKAQTFIEHNYSDKISVDDLATMVGLSRRNLERRFRKVTYNSIVEYIQRVRIEAAKMSLERNRENVNEAMYKAGYSDNKAFRSTFKKITGLSPLEYRRRYNRAVLVEV
ncbi:MAG TPA: helix-turn-helix domain-containing protein [Chitinophagaceae bacterium]|nr:helix-turn-helix domain-containing protein [Chitinophagaceae bacterium]